MIILDLLIAAGLFLGVLVAVTGGVGVLRMPDFYTRAHCAGKGDTLAQLLIFVSLVLYCVAHAGSLSTGTIAVLVRLLLITGFIIVTSPTATHAVARGAQQDGVLPWKQGDARR